MKITHRAPGSPSVSTPAVSSLDATAQPAADKAPRLSCCCRLSELLPLVRQAHDAARDAREAGKQADVAA